MLKDKKPIQKCIAKLGEIKTELDDFCPHYTWDEKRLLVSSELIRLALHILEDKDIDEGMILAIDNLKADVSDI